MKIIVTILLAYTLGALSSFVALVFFGEIKREAFNSLEVTNYEGIVRRNLQMYNEFKSLNNCSLNWTFENNILEVIDSVGTTCKTDKWHHEYCKNDKVMESFIDAFYQYTIEIPENKCHINNLKNKESIKFMLRNFSKKM